MITQPPVQSFPLRSATSDPDDRPLLGKNLKKPDDLLPMLEQMLESGEVTSAVFAVGSGRALIEVLVITNLRVFSFRRTQRELTASILGRTIGSVETGKEKRGGKVQVTLHLKGGSSVLLAVWMHSEDVAAALGLIDSLRSASAPRELTEGVEGASGKLERHAPKTPVERAAVENGFPDDEIELVGPIVGDLERAVAEATLGI